MDRSVDTDIVYALLSQSQILEAYFLSILRVDGLDMFAKGDHALGVAWQVVRIVKTKAFFTLS